MTTPHTHYIPVYAPTSGVRLRASCGLYILPHKHAAHPSCEICQRAMREELQHAADLGDNPFGDPPAYDAAAARRSHAKLEDELTMIITRTARDGRR